HSPRSQKLRTILPITKVFLIMPIQCLTPSPLTAAHIRKEKGEFVICDYHNFLAPYDAIRRSTGQVRVSLVNFNMTPSVFVSTLCKLCGGKTWDSARLLGEISGRLP